MLSDNYPNDFFMHNLRLLKMGGLWVPDRSISTTLHFGLYMIYNSICIFFCQIYHGPAEVFMLKYTLGDLVKAVEHIGMITTHMLGTYKLCTWFIHRKRYLRIMETLNSERFRYSAVEGVFYPGANMKKEMALTALASYGFYIGGNGVPISKAIPALMDLAGVDGSLFTNGMVLCDDVLPYFSWIPFSTRTKGTCIGAIVFQALPVAIFAWQICSHDSLFFAMLNGISGHLENLKGAFSTIRTRCLQKLNLPNVVVLHDELVPGLEEAMYSEIRKCSIHLQTLLFLVEELEDIFTFITLGQVLITLSVFVSRMFLITTTDLFSGTFAAEVEYLMAVGCQGAFFCIFGSKITYKSSELPTAIFSGEWLSASSRFKKIMHMNMLRMGKPIHITVGKFTPLTLQTLISIIKGSYSYFAVLNSKKS